MGDNSHKPLKFGEAGPEIQRLREENRHIRGAYEDCRKEWSELLTHNAEQAAEIARLRADLATALSDEPTRAMLDAARDWSLKKYHQAIGDDAAAGCYRAMRAAAMEGKP